MENEAKFYENEAYLKLSQEDFTEAYKLFHKAAAIYRDENNHNQAAICFASAASCWSKRSGEELFFDSGMSYQEAAEEAKVAGDYKYASLLYKHAAICFERDTEFVNFSECFYLSKECQRRFLSSSLFDMNKGIKEVLKRLLQWLALTISSVVWGHGERPIRTLFAWLFIIFGSSLVYTQGTLLRDGVAFKPGFLDAFYFSIVTFSTVGYGDITPLGFTKVIVIMELFLGMFITSFLLVALTRKYLRA